MKGRKERAYSPEEGQRLRREAHKVSARHLVGKGDDDADEDDYGVNGEDDKEGDQDTLLLSV